MTTNVGDAASRYRAAWEYVQNCNRRYQATGGEWDDGGYETDAACLELEQAEIELLSWLPDKEAGEFATLANSQDPHDNARLLRLLRGLENSRAELDQFTDRSDGTDGWIADQLWPTPCALVDLRNRLNQLGKAIEGYETVLVGKPIKLVAIDGSHGQCVFLDLLRRLGHVTGWDSGGSTIGDGPEPLCIEWKGWMEYSVETDVEDWSHWVPEVVWEIIDSFKRSGIPFDENSGNLGLVFEDCCFVEPNRRRDNGVLEHTNCPRLKSQQ